jgi:hypothetical protein
VKTNIFRFIPLILVAHFTLAQEYKTQSMEAGNGTLLQTQNWMDSQGYSVLTFEFQPRAVVVVFLDPQQNELARHKMEASGIRFFGFTATEKEFILYLTGQVDGKNNNRDYFVCFFKSGNRPPIFSEWLDFPDANKSTFSYSRGDQLFLGNLGKRNTLQLTRFTTVGSKQQSSIVLSDEAINLVKAPRPYGFTSVRSWEGLASPDSLAVSVVKDGPLLEPEKKKFQRVLIDLNTGKSELIERTLQFQGGGVTDIFGNKIFLVKAGETFVRLRVFDLITMNLLKEYNVPPTADSISFKNGPFLNLGTGEPDQKLSGDKKADKELIIKRINASPTVNAIKDNHGNFRLEVGGWMPATDAVITGMNGPTYIQRAFPVCLDKDLNLCSVSEPNQRFKILENFWQQREKRAKMAESETSLIFGGTRSTVLFYYYNPRLKQYSVASEPRQ